jgi:phosphatidyl-myo-inositol dimannoside synthase
MKVLFIARRFPPSVGGMERFAFDLSNALAEKVELQKITWGGSSVWLPLVLPWFGMKAFFKLLATRDIAVIHMQDAVQAPIGWLLHLIFRKPYVVVAHGLDITYRNAFYQHVILPFVRRADMVISISTATKEEADARGVDSAKSRVITLGTHDDYGHPTPDKHALSGRIGHSLSDRKLLLTTGRLVKRKGVEWFILNVLPALVKRDKAVLYLVAGDGTERQAIEAAIKKTNLQKNVILLGRVSEETRSLLYQSCDVFVMPNIAVRGDMEGFGIVAHEAATAELAVVASNLEGIADALSDGKNGILLQPGDARAYAETINRLLADAKKRRALGQKARTYTLANYGWGKIADKYVEVYNSLIK